MTTSSSRRHFIAASAGLIASTVAVASGNPPPLHAPATELAFEVTCDIAPVMSLGTSPFGERRMVPITGGSFIGSGIKGKVLPGGADRQLIRLDGYKQLRATYELETDDGAVISVDNRVLIPAKRLPGQAVFSNISLVAPDGPYSWINNNVYVGTLDALQPQRAAVLIRVFRLV